MADRRVEEGKGYLERTQALVDRARERGEDKSTLLKQLSEMRETQAAFVARRDTLKSQLDALSGVLTAAMSPAV